MKLRRRTQLFIRSDDGREPSDGRRKPFTILRRRAIEVMNYRVWRRFLIIGVSIMAAALMIGYAFVLVYDRTGRFSVSVNNPVETFALTLCEDSKFNTKASILTNDQLVSITNISGAILPNNLNEIDGEHNGDNYLAYTFYRKNVGSAPASLNYELTFNNVTNNLDEAVRVRLYVDGVATNYAKTRSDGGGKEINFCDETFASKYTVCYGAVNYVAIDDYSKFTVVIWVEGDDEDTNDHVLHGKIKFDMKIEAKAPIE